MWEEVAIGTMENKHIKTKQLLISGKTNRGSKIRVNLSAWLLMLFRQAY